MTQEKYEKSKLIQDALQNLAENKVKITVSKGIGKKLSAGVTVHICKDNIDWFCKVSELRIKELQQQFDEL